MNVIIYAKYVNDGTTPSIKNQIKECTKFAKENEYRIVGEYVDYSLSREQFQQMIKDGLLKEFDAILVSDYDRFSKNKCENAFYKYKLKQNGVKVLSAKSADNATDIFIESILEEMAEYLSVELGQKVQRGMDINASIN